MRERTSGNAGGIASARHCCPPMLILFRSGSTLRFTYGFDALRILSFDQGIRISQDFAGFKVSKVSEVAKVARPSAEGSVSCGRTLAYNR
jgi:hypothetical protein